MTSLQFQELLQSQRAAPRRPQSSIEELREASEAKARQYPVPADVTREFVDAGGVPAEWVAAPGAQTDRVLLYFHGGGYYRGSIHTVREMVSRISRASGVTVLVAAYRLAPEHPFPAAFDDAVTAFRWLVTQGMATANIVVGGDSAGGGLAVALLAASRDRGQPLPAGAVCLSPWVDLAQSGDSMRSRAGEDPAITKAYLDHSAELYLDGADPRNPLASPLYADLRGLPPTLIQVGTAEVLLDDATRLAARARAAGVAVELERWEEMTHVWHNNGPALPEGRQAVARIGEFVHARIASVARSRL